MSDPIARLNEALEGRYAVERQLGEGGMATVYLAKDLKHNRSVALKVLKPELAAVVGAERFLAEIETTASLQHPHILPLFDSGEAAGFLFYVMPYVEGESLREKLDREHQLPVEEAVRIATDMAEALDYAHRHGVIHRDIKPGNVLIHDGQPVISDFGIALAVGVAGGGRLTETGLSLGTPHYMSPEQATGDQTVAAATDIYALGCVLYEMLVGEPPYTGSTAQAILGKIIQAKPVSATEARRSVPANVDAAVRKALEKLSADRFMTARDFTAALADPAFRHGEEAVAGAAVGGSTWNRLSVGLAGVAVVAAGVAGWELLRPAPVEPVTRFEMSLPAGVVVAGSGRGLAVSPDGRTLVFADPAGQLYRRELGQPDAVAIPNARSAWYPVFSPDGEWIAYFDQTENGLRKTRLDGGLGQTLAPAGGTSRSAGWGPDGIVFHTSVTEGLWRVPDAGGEPQQVASGPALQWLDLMPDGRNVLAQQAPPGEERIVVAVSLETGEQTVLFAGATPRYVETGHVIFWRDGGLWAVPFDASRMQTTGDAVPVVENVAASTTVDNGLADYGVGGGVLFYREGTPVGRVPVWVDRDGDREVLDPTLSGTFGAPAISPDGEMIAFEYDTPDAGTQDIWIYRIAQGTFSRLTFAGALNRYPFWSPDGHEVGFSSDRDGLPALYARPADLSSDARLVYSDPDDAVHEGSWTPDGAWLVHRYGSTLTNATEDIRYAAPGADSATVIVATPAIERNPALSPDGRWLAYTSDATGDPEVYVRPFPGPGGQYQVSTGGGTNPLWSPDGRELLYISEVAPFPMVAARVRFEPDFAVASRELLVEWNQSIGYAATHPEWDVSPTDGRILALGLPGAAEGRYIVVENFDEELARLSPN